MGGAAAAGGEGFERVFDLVGGHGLFQWRLLFILALQLIVLTWHHIGYAFLGNVPDHWCSLPDLAYSNWTLDQQKLISLPKLSADPENPDEIKFDKCQYYHLNYASLIASSSSFEEAYAKVDWENVTTKTCSRWDYDRSIYHSTVATEFNLVCTNRWKVATIQGSYMGGGLVGTLTFGSLSDRYLGRRKTVLISLSMVVCGGIIAAFSTNYWMFLFFRFIISIGVSGSMQNCFVLITEHADKGYRALLGIVEQVPFALGYMILPGLAYFLRDWNTLQLSFGVISCGLVVYYWILPESPRWLATHGYTDRAIGALYKMAEVNRLPKPNREDLEEIVRQCQDENQQQMEKGKLEAQLKNNEGSESSSISGVGMILGLLRKWLRALVRNFKNLMKTAEIRKRSLVFWCIFLTVAMVYYGIVFAGNITSDPYLLVFLGGLMEVPAYTLIVPFVSKLGRRPTTAGNFVLTGVCMLGLSRTPNEYEAIRITLAMLAKLFISSGFAIIYLLGAELYPTELRTTGLAVGIFCGRIGAISAPYIVDLMSNVSRDLPTIIFGTVSIAAALVSLLLPETKTLEMSDKVIEIELHAQDEIKAKEERRRQSLATSIGAGGGI